MSVATPPYLEIVDFIAESNPEAVAHFRPSTEAQARFEDLADREKTAAISAAEKAELDHFMELEHLLRLAKAKAKLILARGQ